MIALGLVQVRELERGQVLGLEQAQPWAQLAQQQGQVLERGLELELD